MKKLRKYEKLTPVLENILNIIRSQVKTCLEYVKNHPNCQDIQIHSVETSQDCYDVYMASAEDITYNKPVDGLLSEDLLNNADYEMDDNAQQIYVYEDEEEDDEDDDDEEEDDDEDDDDDEEDDDDEQHANMFVKKKLPKIFRISNCPNCEDVIVGDN